MGDRFFEKIAALSALVVAGLSLLYAVAYLVIAPGDQRKSDVDAFYRSYLAHPGGMRIASMCLLLSGFIIGFPAVALRRRGDEEVAHGVEQGQARHRQGGQPRNPVEDPVAHLPSSPPASLRRRGPQTEEQVSRY